MKKATWIAACLLVCTGQAFAAGDYFGQAEPPKVKESSKSAGQVTPPSPNAGGETFATATPIPGLPYADGGVTCGAVDDYYPVCAFGGNSVAPDLVYSYTPAANTCINIDLCASGYDTIVHVYDSALNLIGCNDDFCGLRSAIEGLALTGGTTYYIVIDGYADDCGAYDMIVSECPPPCDSSCPPGSIAEGEPTCSDEYVDATNGGCNSVPAVFTRLPCDDTGVTVCGTYGTYLFAGGNRRDTDWYEISITSPTVLEVCVCGAAPTQVAVLNSSCSPVTLVCGSVFGGPNETVCCQVPLNPGIYWIFVGTDGFSGIACGTPYTMNISGYNCPPVGVEAADWTNIKSLYR
jgi:hypothetical protein